MRTLKSAVILSVFGFSQMLLSAGCMSSHIDLVRTGSVQMIIHDHPSVRFLCPYVYQFEDRVTIGGCLKRFVSASSGISPGKVEVRIVDPSGRILETIETPTTPNIIPKRSRCSASFQYETDIILMEGSTIHLKYSTGETTLY